MNKPFSILYEEFRQGLTNLINSSELHPLIIESVLKNYISEVSGFASKQYQIDKAKYEDEMRNHNEDTER